MAAGNRSKLRDAIALILTVTALAGLVVRWSVRDSLPVTAGAFYALPVILVAVLLLVAALLWLRGGRRRAALACAAAGIVAAGAWTVANWRRHDCPTAPSDVKLLLWNAARGFGGWTSIADEVERSNADVIGLVEAGGSTAEWRAFWKERFPEHDLYLAGSGLAILSRATIVEHHVRKVGQRSVCADVELDLDGRRVRVLLIDAVVRPFSNRRSVVERVFELARARPDLPTIVMGDFNTPDDSVWFDAVRSDFAHAFERAGTGLPATWPMPLPLLAIDHVWVSAGLRVDCARIGWSWLSDHRPVEVRVSLAPAAAGR